MQTTHPEGLPLHCSETKVQHVFLPPGLTADDPDSLLAKYSLLDFIIAFKIVYKWHYNITFLQMQAKLKILFNLVNL